MRIGTPEFWYAQDSARRRLFALALFPLGYACGWCVRKRFDFYFPVPMEKPVICVGNLTAGGAGKTPVALSLCDILKERGHNPHFLTRGYGGTETGPLQVAPSRDTALDVGDEALLLVEKAPTWVSINRALGAQQAFDTGASIVILDDGFQNPSFYKDFSIVAADGAVGFGNGRIFPAGPLRESLSFGLSRANAVVMIGEDRTGAAEQIRAVAPDMPILRARYVPEESNIDLAGKTVYAFAGIGRPQKFKDSLIEAGAQLEGWGSFPDHFAYVEEDLKELMAAAEAASAVVVTTAKDYVRVPASLKSRVSVFRIRLEWEDAGQVARLIEDALQKRR